MVIPPPLGQLEGRTPVGIAERKSSKSDSMEENPFYLKEKEYSVGVRVVALCNQCWMQSRFKLKTSQNPVVSPRTSSDH